jgi:hypothetical protein
VENPTAVPRAMGRRMEAAGLAKTDAGSVRDGMKVVIVAAFDYGIWNVVFWLRL